MKRIQLVLFFIFFVTSFVFSQNELPIHSDNSTLKPLGSLFNKDLQKELELQLNKNPKWKNLIQQNICLQLIFNNLTVEIGPTCAVIMTHRKLRESEIFEMAHLDQTPSF